MSRRMDETGFGSVKILQDPDTFCYGADAVLLAGFAAEHLNARKNRTERLCDLGTGNGIIPLILSHKTEIPELHGLEVQEKMAALARENAELNHLEGRMIVHHANVRDLIGSAGKLEEMGGPGSFDAVTSNPPYTAGTGGMHGENEAKTIARHEVLGSLEEFLQCASLLLRHRGDLFMIHRPSRLVDLCVLSRKWDLEPKELCFISGNPGEKANLILMHCVKGGGPELKVLEPVSVRDGNGGFSEYMLSFYERCVL